MKEFPLLNLSIWDVIEMMEWHTQLSCHFASSSFSHLQPQIRTLLLVWKLLNDI